jgi:MFS family permease
MTTSVLAASVRYRITSALFTAQSLFSAAFIASFTLSAIIGAQLAGSDAAAGTPTTLNLLGRAAIAYPIGWLMDRFGRRNGLSAGYFLGAIGAAVSVWAIVDASYWGFLLGAFLMGAARGSAEQSRYVAAEVQPAANRARAMGLLVFAGTIGAIGGPRLIAPSERLALLWQLDPITGVFLLAALLLLLAAVLTFIFLRPDPLAIAHGLFQSEHTPEEQAEVNAAPVRPLRQVFSSRSVQLAVAAMLIGQLTMTLLMVITPLYMHHHQHGLDQIANVIMAHTLGMFGLSSLTGWLVDRLGPIPMIVIGALILALSSVLTPLSVAVLPLAVALFLLGLGWNFCFVAGSSLLAEGLAPAERGRVQGSSETVVALASGAGSLGTGVAFALGGITAVAVASLILTLALAAAAIWISWSQQNLKTASALR